MEQVVRKISSGSDTCHHKSDTWENMKFLACFMKYTIDKSNSFEEMLHVSEMCSAFPSFHFL